MPKVALAMILSLLLCSQVLAAGKIKRLPSQITQVVQARNQALNRLTSDIGSQPRVRYGENLVPVLLEGRLSEAAGGELSSAALAFFSRYKELFLLSDPQVELRLQTRRTDPSGHSHLRFQQVYQGLLVWGSQMTVHFHREGYIKSVTGRWEPSPQIDVNPVLTEAQATEIARLELKKDKFRKSPTAELIIFPWKNQTYLAWQVTLSPDFAHRWIFFVDAKSGEIILKYNDVKNDGPVPATGIDLHDSLKAFGAYILRDTVFMVDVTKPMYIPPVDSGKGIIVTGTAHNDTASTKFDVVFDPDGDAVFDDDSTLKAAVSAQYYTGLIYDYFYQVHGRNSWDDSGSTIASLVHFGQDYANAFWSGDAIVFGDGDGFLLSPLSGALDITTHELAHGITQSSADLLYLGEWGALNEHISDFWGAVLDSADWLIGEDCFTPGMNGDALRNMADPHNPGGFFNDFFAQPAHMDEYLYWPNEGYFYDNGAVHYNNGIPNRASYLLATSVSRDTAASLYYQGLVNYLVPKSRFVDLRYALLQSAEDLFSGAQNHSQIVFAIETSFDSVGIYDLYADPESLIFYDDGVAAFLHLVGPDSGSNISWAERFTPHAPCSLTAVTAAFATTGTNGSLQIYSDLEGVPDSLLLNLSFQRTLVYPDWQTIDLSAYNFFFDQDFYVAFSSTSLDSFVLSDAMLEYNHVNFYAGDLNQPGYWFPLESFDSVGGDPLIRAVVNYSVGDQGTVISGDVNSSGGITLGDVIHLLNYLFDRDKPPCLGTDPGNCWDFGLTCRGDVNNSGTLTLADIVYLLNYVFDRDNSPCLGTDPGNCWTPVASGACSPPLP